MLGNDLGRATLARLSSYTKHEADLYATLRISEQLFADEPCLHPIVDILTWSGTAFMGTDLLAALLDQPADSLIGALGLGVELQLLAVTTNEHETDKRYRIHRLVQEVQRAELPLSEREDWGRQVCARMAAWFEKRRRSFDQLPEYEDELDHLRIWSEHADQRSWPEHTRLLWLQAYPPFHRGEYRTSREQLERARTALGHSDDDELRAHVLSDLGSILLELGEHRDGLELAEQALVIREKILGPEHPDTALSLNNVGASYDALGQHQQALEFEQQALDTQRKVLGPEHPDTARSLNNMGGSYGHLGQHQRAVELQQQALEIWSKVLGLEHPDTARCLTNMAWGHGQLGQHQRALEFAKRALEIQRKVLGLEHPDTASTLNNMGWSYGELGQHQQALEHVQQALEIRKKVLGPEHMRTGRSSNSVGHAYGNLYRYAEAASYFADAYTVLCARLGAHSDEALDALINQARCLDACGKTRHARDIVDRCVRSLPPRHSYRDRLKPLQGQIVPRGFRKRPKPKRKKK